MKFKIGDRVLVSDIFIRHLVDIPAKIVEIEPNNERVLVKVERGFHRYTRKDGTMWIPSQRLRIKKISMPLKDKYDMLKSLVYSYSRYMDELGCPRFENFLNYGMANRLSHECITIDEDDEYNEFLDSIVELMGEKSH